MGASKRLPLLCGQPQPRRRRDPHPEMSLLPFDIYQCLDEARALFPELDGLEVQTWFVPQRTLACIRTDSTVKIISIHSLLNEPRTPRDVFRAIFTHELLHLIHRPAQIDGKWVSHTPEFWEAERKYEPRMKEFWAWIHYSFCLFIQPDEKREATVVARGWKDCYSDFRFTMEEVIEARRDGIHYLELYSRRRREIEAAEARELRNERRRLKRAAAKAASH